MNGRRLGYSICLAIVITSFSYALFDRGGELVLWPGVVAQVMLNFVLLAIPTGDDFYTLPSQAFVGFNIAFYASIIFIASWLISLIRDERKS